MTFDLRARNLTCTIDVLNADGSTLTTVDVSDEVLAYEFASNQLNTQSPSFLIGVRGTITLGEVDGTITSLDSRDLAGSPPGAQIWARGNRVNFSLADESGTLKLLPFPLFILTVPQPPNLPSLEIQVSVGDGIALQSYQQPEGDESGVALGTETDRTGVIDSLLAAASLPALAPGNTITEYPFNTPIQKNSSGSWVSLAGQIAASAGHALWQQSDGDIRVTRLDLAPTSAAVSIQLSSEGDVFEYINNDERPPEVLTVIGSGKEASEVVYPIVTEKRVTGSRGSVLGPGASNTGRSLTVLYQRTVETLTAQTLTIERTKQVPRKVINPNSNAFSTSLQVAEKATERKKFRADSEALSSHTIDERWARGWINNQVNNQEFTTNLDDVIDYRNTDIRYTYNPTTGQLREKDTEVDSIRASFGAGFASPTEDERTQDIREDWRDKGNGRWAYDKTDLRTLQELYQGNVGDADPFALAPDPANSESAETNSGEATPPQTERLPKPFEIKDVQYKGSAKFQPIGGAAPQPKPETINIRGSVCVSNEQCDFLAGLLGGIRQGRALGARFLNSLPDWFLDSYQPLPRFDFTDLLGVTTAYLLDGWSLAGDNEECVFGGSLIEQGIVTAGMVVPRVKRVYRLETRIKLRTLANVPLALWTEAVETRIKFSQLLSTAVKVPSSLTNDLIFYHDMATPGGADQANQHNPGTWDYFNDRNILTENEAGIGNAIAFRNSTDNWGTYDYGVYEFPNDNSVLSNTIAQYFGSGDWQYSIWVKMDSPPTSDPFGGQSGAWHQPSFRFRYGIARSDVPTFGTPEEAILLEFNLNTNELEFTVWNSSRTSTTVTAAAAIGTLYMISIWHDGANEEIGISVNDGTPVTAAHTGGVDNSIGAGYGNWGPVGSSNYNYFGVLGRDAFHSRLLTAAELTELYNSGVPILYADI